MLYDLNQQQGRTIAMVLHDLNQAWRYAGYLVAIKEGRIFAAGDPQSVMTQENVRAVFGLDSQIFQDPVTGMPMCVPISQKARSNMRS
ncbi:MAG: ABC transporter ATP-binding protein [Myxacorys chilensis ATA2-1-KO14]|nr:ABC transporter ATP-binding protein [Myxacorys chilensis ATA2-1-KO14]